MTRAQPRGIVAVVAVWGALFAYLAAIEPVLHDGWYLVLDQQRHPPSVGAFLEFVRHSYLADNPRLGQWLAYLAFASPAIHVVLAAGFAIATLTFAFVLAHARWPRPGDAGRLAVIAALAFVALPNPGQLFGYRPFTANYAWAFAVTASLAVPYRLALAAPPRARGTLAAIGMFVLGVAAGMSNEHTGPAAIAAIAIAIELVRRRDRRVPAWMLAGLLGLVAGFALLVGAPGQDVRYHGLADRGSILANVTERGLAGNLRIVGMSALYSAGAWLTIAIAMVATARARGPEARWRRDVLALALVAIAMILTVLLSPKQGARLFYAPAMLLVAAAARAVDEATRGARWLVALAAAGAIGCAGWTVHVARDASADAAARDALLRAAPPGSVPAVPPFRHFAPTWWSYGDDFRSAPLRERVARAVYGKDDVTLASDDPRLLRSAGVTLALVIDPPDPDAARAADPDGLGFSEQLFTPPGLAIVGDHFRAVAAALAARPTPPRRVALRARGLAAPSLGDRAIEVAWWDAAGGVHVPADDAPLAGATHLLRAGADARPIAGATGTFAALLADAPPGGYLLLACDASACHVLAARPR